MHGERSLAEMPTDRVRRRQAAVSALGRREIDRRAARDNAGRIDIRVRVIADARSSAR